MEKFDFKSLRSTATQRLAGAEYDPKKLILLHTGASALVMIVLLLIQHILQGQIDQTGGLSGLGLRSILSTASSSLKFLVNLVMPFWSFGYLYASLQMARQLPAAPDTLLEGFRRFGGVLRLCLIRALIYTAIALLCFYPSALIYLVTPLSDSLVDAAMPFITADGMLNQTALLEAGEAAMDQFTLGLLPFAGIFLALYAVTVLPLYYKFRMADYALLEGRRIGAFAALWMSARMMKGNRLRLFKLDLRFWWFYVLELLTVCICYADALLALAGITLPISSEVLFYGSYLAYLLARVALYWWAKNPVAVTYALVYDQLKPEELPQLPENQTPQY